MKRFISLLSIILVFLCSCYDDFDIHIDDTEEISYVDDVSGITYVASASGKTYHIEGCYVVKNIKTENIRKFQSKQFFIDRGMQPCKRCNP